MRCVSDFCGLISAIILPYVTVLPAGTFPLRNRNNWFVSDGIFVTTTCASQTVSFANKFFQMALVGTLVRCLYYRDDTLVGLITTLDWCCPQLFVTGTVCDMLWDSLSFPDVPAFWCCMIVLLAIGHIYFLCSGHDGIVTLFFIYLVYFTLFAADGEVAWVGLEGFWYLSLDYSSRFTLRGRAVWSFTLGCLEIFFNIGAGGVVNASLFDNWISASNVFLNSLIDLSR